MSNSSNSLSSIISPRSEIHGQGEKGHGMRRKPPLGGRLRTIIANLFHSTSATIGIVIILFWVFVAITAPIISPYSPTEMPGTKLEDPSPEHWFGTDNIGRDVLTRLFWGTRVVVALAPISVLLGIMMGAPLGLIAGYAGGTVDTIIMRGTDIIYSFPMLLIQILILTSVGPSPITVVFSVAIGNIPVVTRIVRSLALDERTKDYVDAARLRGERRRYILLREILPNVSSPIIVDSTIRIGYAIMYIGSLGFLGLGIPPPTPDWGGMINEGRPWIFLNPWVVLAPAAALSSVVIALNLVADGIREIEQQR